MESCNGHLEAAKVARRCEAAAGGGGVISPRDAGAGLEAVVGEAARSGRSVTQTAGSMRGRSGSLEGGERRRKTGQLPGGTARPRGTRCQPTSG